MFSIPSGPPHDRTSRPQTISWRGALIRSSKPAPRPRPLFDPYEHTSLSTQREQIITVHPDYRRDSVGPMRPRRRDGKAQLRPVDVGIGAGPRGRTARTSPTEPRPAPAQLVGHLSAHCLKFARARRLRSAQAFGEARNAVVLRPKGFPGRAPMP